MKKLILMSLMAVFCLTTVNAQEIVASEEDQKKYEVVEEMPEFPGGMEALIKYLSTNIKYPKDAVKQKIQGRVLVTFVVDTDGSIKDVKVAKAVYPSIDKESVRVVKKMPKWTPGKKDGCPVRVQYTLPIAFHL